MNNCPIAAKTRPTQLHRNLLFNPRSLSPQNLNHQNPKQKRTYVKCCGFGESGAKPIVAINGRQAVGDHTPLQPSTTIPDAGAKRKRAQTKQKNVSSFTALKGPSGRARFDLFFGASPTMQTIGTRAQLQLSEQQIFCNGIKERRRLREQEQPRNRNDLWMTQFEREIRPHCRIAARQPSIRSKPQRMKLDLQKMLQVGETCRSCTRASV